MKRFAIIVGLLLFAVPAFAESARDLALKDLVKANAAYREAKYSDAIAGYEGVLNHGLESAQLYYNLGNAYFKAGQTGKAVLNYERAKRLAPRDMDLLANLKYVVPQETLVIENHNFVQRLFAEHTKFYSLDEMAVILLVIFFLLAVTHLVSLYIPGTKKVAWRILLALTVILTVYGIGFVIKLAQEKNISVVIHRSEAKFEPNEKGTVYFELPEGQTVEILEQDGSWQKVKRPDGKLGWVLNQDLEKI